MPPATQFYIDEALIVSLIEMSAVQGMTPLRCWYSVQAKATDRSQFFK